MTTTPTDEQTADLVEQKRQLIHGVRKATADWMRGQADPSCDGTVKVVVGGLADVTAIAATTAFDVSREKFLVFCGKSWDTAMEVRKRREAG